MKLNFPVYFYGSEKKKSVIGQVSLCHGKTVFRWMRTFIYLYKWRMLFGRTASAMIKLRMFTDRYAHAQFLLSEDVLFMTWLVYEMATFM